MAKRFEIVARMKGTAQLKKTVRKFAKQYPQATAAAIYAEALDLSAKVKPQIPVDTSILRTSLYVKPPTDTGIRAEAEVGVNTDYAAAVHERTEANHPVGKAKYISDPWNARLGGTFKRLAKRIKLFAEKGITVGGIPATEPKKPKGSKARKGKGKK